MYLQTKHVHNDDEKINIHNEHDDKKIYMQNKHDDKEYTYIISTCMMMRIKYTK